MGEGTPGTGGGGAKVCVRCGVDCAGKARTRDARGRYLCGTCVEGLKKERAAREESSQRADREERHGPDAEESVIPLADEEPAGLIEAGGPTARNCPGCGILLARGAVLCTTCGYDTRTGGIVAAAAAGKKAGGRTCIKCGYALEGLKDQRCPECGTQNTERSRREIIEKRAARDVVRSAYTKPVIMFMAGLGVTLLATVIGSGGSLDEGVKAAVLYLIKYAIYVPVGVIVFFACCMIWLGFDAPMHLTALRLAAVYAVTDAVAHFAGFIPIWFLQMAIVGAVYIGLLQDLLELDLQDAMLVGVITFGVRVALFLFAFAWLNGLFQ